MKQKGKMSGKKLKQMFVTYTFVLPDFIGLLVFIIIPIIYSFYMAYMTGTSLTLSNLSEYRIMSQCLVTLNGGSLWEELLN